MGSMRVGLVVIAMLAACDGQQGAYLIVEGGGVAFTDVEFYFGERDHASDDPRPVPRLRESDDYRGLQQIGLARQVIDGVPDVVRDADGDGTLTYYLPPGDGNEGLAYVLVLARDAEGKPVGVAEAANVIAPNDAAYEYRLRLAPFADSGARTWGGDGADCVMWRRDRKGIGPSIIAVVREDDRDCDTSPAIADCDDVAYCPPGSQDPGDACEAAQTPCVDDRCRLGVCESRPSNTSGSQEPKQCVATACLAEAWCDACVDDPWNIDRADTLACISAYEAGIPKGHVELRLPTTNLGTLCQQTFSVEVGIPCGAARVEYPLPDPNGFTYELGSTATGLCSVTVHPPAANPNAAFIDVHLVISFPAPNMTPPIARTYAVIGVAPMPVIECTVDPDVSPPSPLPGYPRCEP